MPNTGRRAHLLTMNLNKNLRPTKKQKIMHKRFKSSYQTLARKSTYGYDVVNA